MLCVSCFMNVWGSRLANYGNSYRAASSLRCGLIRAIQLCRSFLFSFFFSIFFSVFFKNDFVRFSRPAPAARNRTEKDRERDRERERTKEKRKKERKKLSREKPGTNERTMCRVISSNGPGNRTANATTTTNNGHFYFFLLVFFFHHSAIDFVVSRSNSVTGRFSVVHNRWQ